MKTLMTIICLCFAYGFSAQAANDDGDILYVYTNDASTGVSYSLDNLDKLTFGNDAISIWAFGNRTDYEYKKISLMTFREDIKPITAIEQLNIDNPHVNITYDRSLSLVRVESGHILQGLAIYDIQGRLVAKEGRKLSSYQVSLQGKHQGIYVIKVGENGKASTMRIVK